MLVKQATIAIGSGGIKPCVSAHLGDQFGQQNGHLLSRAYSFFYFGINLGALVSTLLTPLLLDRIGPQVAFGLPGLLSGGFWGHRLIRFRINLLVCGAGREQ